VTQAKSTGERLTKIRKSLDLTQVAFCQHLGISGRSLTRYESGERDISNDELRIISDMGFNIHWLLTGEGSMCRDAETDSAASAELVVRTLLNWLQIEKLTLSPDDTAKAVGVLMRMISQQPAARTDQEICEDISRQINALRPLLHA